MRLIPVKTPRVLKYLYPNYIWNIKTSENVIYLTFDDGPTPEITEWTLNTLEAYNAKATFFCIGDNVEKHPDILKKTIASGHAIGNHTQSHIKGWQTTTKDYIKNTENCQRIFKSKIDNSTFESINLFRPPYGKITRKQGKALINQDYKIIMWDVIAFDWDNAISKAQCLKNVITNTGKGSIVVFHDSFKASKHMQYTLPKVLDYFTNKGYRFDALKL